MIDEAATPLLRAGGLREVSLVVCLIPWTGGGREGSGHAVVCFSFPEAAPEVVVPSAAAHLSERAGPR